MLDATPRNYEKFLLHLRRGSTYRVTFLARAEKAGVYVKARFDKGPGNGLVYWDSNPIKLETETASILSITSTMATMWLICDLP